MAFGVNRVVLVGTLGKDPELKTFGHDSRLVELSVATSERFKNRTGEREEKTQWHTVKAWGKLADTCSQHLAKGRQVYVDGKIDYHSYEKDGVTRYRTYIVAQSVQFLGAKSEAGRQAGSHMDEGAYEADDTPF